MFDVPPPGTIVEQRTVYLRGEAMNSRYVAVASRTALPGSPRDTVRYQPYLSIYAQSDGNARFKQIYRSPGVADPLALVPRSIAAPGSLTALPRTQLTLVGAAEFMAPAVQQLVARVHTEAADCGATNVYVLGIDARGRLVERAAFHNACSLAARIVRGAPDTRASLRLSGPYYSRTAPLCCPTRAHVSAVARWNGKRWTTTPPYFTLR